MTNNDQSRKPAKPYLRKGSGATGRLMSKINYPTLTRTRSRQSHNSVNNAQSSMQDGADSNLRLPADLDCESANTINRNQWPELSTRSNNNINNFARSSSSSPAQDQQPGSSRPLTGTTDSGCPEDPLYLLSPALTEHLASVVRDVTTDADVNSSSDSNSHEPVCSPITYSDEGRLAHDLTTHSVIYDVSDYSASAISTSGIGRVTPSKGELSDGRVVGDSSEQGGSTPSVVADVSTIEHASSIGPVTTTTTAALPSKTRKLEAVSGKERTESCALNREIAVILPPVQSTKQLKQYSKGVRMPKAVNLSLGESTAEFEHLEARVHEMLASEGVDGQWPASSDTSHNTDGTRSKHWRSVIADFRQEALKNNEFPSRQLTPSTNTDDDGKVITPRAVEYQHTALLDDSQSYTHRHISKTPTSAASSSSSLGLRPMRFVFPSIFDKQRKRSVVNIRPSHSTLRHPESTSTSTVNEPTLNKKQTSLRHSHSTPVLERYTDGEESPGGQLAREIIKRGDIVAQNQMRAPQIASSPLDSYAKAEAHHLAKQLRDLIAHLDIVSEEHRHKISEFDEVYDGLVSENDQLQNQIRALNQRIKQLEETDQLRNETLTMLKESERTRMEDLKQLKRENALLTRKQRSKESDDSTMVQICKEQMEELKKSKRDLERQRIDQRAQIRKLETTIKEKDKRIDEIAAEKERLERRFKAVSNEQAKVRGRRAEETLYQEAVERASNKAPVTMAVKRIGGMTYNCSSNPKENLMAKNGSDTRAVRRSDERTESSASERREEALLLDSTPRSQSPVNGVVPGSGMGVGKSVRWNEPLTTELFFSPPSERQETERSSNESSVNVHQGSVEPNADMQLVRVEDNIIGRASLFQSVADFTVYTRTHCGCNYYEYSNTDTRWVHPSHKYQVNYYGQMGATTVQIESGVLLVRHFLNGQLEIYRQSGEITLVTSTGRRIEVIKDENGLKRIEIYELNGKVRVIGADGCEVLKSCTSTSCYRLDGSYVSHVQSDDSFEWRAIDYIVRRFRSGDVKVRLTLIETSITMMCADVGTIKHLNQPTAHKYCVEWGTVARNRSRQAAQAHVHARSSNSTPQSFKPVYFDTTLNNNNSSIGVN